MLSLRTSKLSTYALRVACWFWRVPNTLRIEQRKECELNIFNTLTLKIQRADETKIRR